MIVFNPGAGRKRSADETRALMRRLGSLPGAEVVTPERNRQLADLAADAAARGATLVVAAGGDGTISCVAGQLAGSSARLGIVPLGTFNFLARALGVPQDADAAIEALQGGTTRVVSAGAVNNRFFVNNASIGAYAMILKTREATYRRWGRSRLAAYWSVIVALVRLYRALGMTIEIDGRTLRVESPLAFVAVRPYQLERYDLEGAEAVRNGKMALFLARDGGRVDLLWRAVRILGGWTEPGRDYRILTGTDIVIRPDDRRLSVARDGERDTMEGPFRFSLQRDALHVVVPADQSAEEPGDEVRA